MLLMISSCKSDDPHPEPEPPEIGVAGDGNLSAHLDFLLEANDVPGLAAMSTASGQLIESAASGERALGGGRPVSVNDQWHVGSITKSMTATLCAILVEKGHLTWETKVSEVIQGSFDEAYANVTIYELLAQTSGFSGTDLLYDPADQRPLREIRMEWSLEALNLPPGPKGTFVYSNNNYVVAGTMLEVIMNDTWESLMQTHLFDPLGMNDSGFGAPGTPSQVDQPAGHSLDGSTWVVFDPGLAQADNPAALGPAGTVHTTLADMKKYVDLHLGLTNLISAQSLSVLHTPVSNNYALGWNVTANGIFHSGSNTRWFAQLFIALNDELAVFAATNSYDLGGNRSTNAVQQAMSTLGQRIENLD